MKNRVLLKTGFYFPARPEPPGRRQRTGRPAPASTAASGASWSREPQPGGAAPARPPAGRARPRVTAGPGPRSLTDPGAPSHPGTRTGPGAHTGPSRPPPPPAHTPPARHRSRPGLAAPRRCCPAARPHRLPADTGALRRSRAGPPETSGEEPRGACRDM